MNHFHMTLLSGAAYLTFAVLAVAEPSTLQHRVSDTVRTEHFHHSKTLAVQGYDVVAYHQGGAKKGTSTHSAKYKGLVYHFATAENKATFEKNPTAYEPLYGGWCAWAMLKGKKTKINPERFKIVDGRLLLFYDGAFGNTLNSWNKRSATEGDSALIGIADKAWDGVLR